MKMEFTESLGKIATFTIIILSVFLLTVKSKNKLSNRLFGACLLLIAFDLTGFFISIPSEYLVLKSLKMASSLLQMPLFYFYVLSACYANFSLIKKHLLHALLFILFFGVLIASNFSSRSVFIYEIVVEIQWLAYIIAIFIILGRYKTLYLENYSEGNHTTYSWLFQITVISCIGHAFVATRWFLSNSGFYEFVPNMNLIISLSVLSITTFFVLKALYQPSLFKGINIDLTPSKSLLESANSEMNEAKNVATDEDLKRIMEFMEQEKPYLDDKLTLEKLASLIGMPERELSIIINQNIGKHFFDFINEYRINNAKEILRDPDKKELTVQEILYMVGFNSKSSFYTAFKKFTKQTPVDFRKNEV